MTSDDTTTNQAETTPVTQPEPAAATETSTETAPETTAKATTRRRRAASRPAGPPVATGEGEGDGEVAAENAAIQDAAAEDAPAKPVRKRAPRKKAAAKSVKPAESATDAGAQTDGPGQTDGPAQPHGTEAPGSPPVLSAQAPEEAGTSAKEPAAERSTALESAAQESGEAAPAPRTRRKAAAKKTTTSGTTRRRKSAEPAPAGPVVAEPVVAEPDVAELIVAEPVAAGPAGATAEPAQPVDVVETVAAPSAEPAAQPAAPEQPAPEAAASGRGRGSRRGPAPLATTMLVFQPPEPAAPRRRRAASRPAGPPQPSPAEPQTAASAAAGFEAAEHGVAEHGVVEETAAEPAATVEGIESAESTQTQPDGVESADKETNLVDEAETVSGDGEDQGEEPAEGARRARRRRRGGRGRRGRTRGDGEGADDDEDDEAGAEAGGPPAPGEESAEDEDQAEEEEVAAESEEDEETGTGTTRRRRRRRRRGASAEAEPEDNPPGTVTKVREPRRRATGSDDVTGVKGSTRLEAKKQRRREGREAGRRRPVITEAEFLARRESVERIMVVREGEGRTQIGVLEDGVLVEHYVARRSQTSMVGNVYLGKVQNVLPSMEAAFVDIGKGRNAVLYAGEVNWDAAGMEGQPRRIEHALRSGESVLVQVTKDPIGHKGARLTSQISLPGRYLVYVPDGSMTGISRKLPDTERARLKRVLRQIVPDDAGVIVRTAAEGASEEELANDVARLQAQWTDIERKTSAVNPPTLLYGEPDLAIRVVRDIFNEDFTKCVVSGDEAWATLQGYMGQVAPDLVARLERWNGDKDAFTTYRIDEQLAKGLDRKVWLPSGGSLVIDRTEAMTVVDVNTGKFTGAGGNLEETVTKNNLEAAEEIVRQLRLRDIGGIIVVDFIDMVLESNRDLVLRRLLECLGRDRTKHQVAEVTSLGLVQMTRKRVGQGLLEVFSEPCEHCAGRGVVIYEEPVERRQGGDGRGGAGGNNGGNPRRSPSRPGTAAAAAIARVFESQHPPVPEGSPDGEVEGEVAADLVAVAAERVEAEALHPEPVAVGGNSTTGLGWPG